MTEDSYLPVGCDFYDVFTAIADKNTVVKFFYFNQDKTLNSAEGLVEDIFTRNREEFARVGGTEIRLDRIITAAGRPGPAWDDYEALGNACLDCNLGY
jgi:transcriptional antiterminator Rof (Rho-off)